MKRMFTGFGFVFASLVLVATLGFFVMSVDQREVVNISVVGHLTEPQLQNVKALLEETDLATSDTEDVQQKLTSLDWVRYANVRKIWPDGVSVEGRAGGGGRHSRERRQGEHRPGEAGVQARHATLRRRRVTGGGMGGCPREAPRKHVADRDAVVVGPHQ